MQQNRLADDIKNWRQGSMKTFEDDTMKRDNFPNVGCTWISGKFYNG